MPDPTHAHDHTSPPSRLARWRRHWQLRWKNHLGTVALVAAVVVGMQLWQTRDVPSGPAPDGPVTLLKADGRTVQTTLAAWRRAHPGQPVALHFWAEWCPICRTEEHSITRLARDWPVLTVAMQSGEAAQVQRVLQQRQLPWPTVLDPRGVWAQRHGIKAVPGFVVVDAHGQLRTPSAGYTTEIGMRLRLWWVRLVS